MEKSKIKYIFFIEIEITSIVHFLILNEFTYSNFYGEYCIAFLPVSIFELITCIEDLAYTRCVSCVLNRIEQ